MSKVIMGLKKTQILFSGVVQGKKVCGPLPEFTSSSPLPSRENDLKAEDMETVVTVCQTEQEETVSE